MNYQVVYQGQFPPADWSAGVRRVANICRGLAAAGNDVTLLTPGHFGEQVECAEPYRVRVLGQRQDSPSLFSRQRFWRAVTKNLLADRPDFTVFYDTTLDSLNAMKRLRARGVRIGYELCDMNSTTVPGVVRNTFYRLAERWLPTQSELNIVITSTIQHWVESVAPGTPSIVIPGLFDTQQFRRDDKAGAAIRQRLNIGRDEILFTYAGSWWKHKGVATLIDAFELACRRSQLPLRLAVAGKYCGNKEEDDVVQLVADRGLMGRVILPGYLDSDGMVAFLSGSDVVVSPSWDVPFNVAAFPTKVAEYAGTGCCIVASSVGDIPRYFKNNENAFLVKPGNAELMAQAFVTLAGHSELRAALGNQAASTARANFDYLDCGHTLDRQIQAVLRVRHAA